MTKRQSKNYLNSKANKPSIDNNTPLFPILSSLPPISSYLSSPSTHKERDNTEYIPPFSYIEKKFDRKDFSVTLSDYGSLLKFVLYDFFIDKFEIIKIYDIPTSKKNKYKKKIEGNGLEVFFLPNFSLKVGHHLPYYKFTIHNCSNDIETEIRKLVESYGDKLTVSWLEIALDFYGDDVDKLRNFLNTHFYSPYSYSDPLSIEGTEYGVDLSTLPSRGNRCYPKPENDKDGLKCVRLEIIVRRKKLYKMEKSGLTSPYPIDPFLKLFEFRILDTEKVVKRLRKYCKEKLEIKNEERVERYIEKWFYVNNTLQKRFRSLQKIDKKHAGRFLLPFPELKDALFSPSTDDSPPVPSPTTPSPLKPFVAPPRPLLDRIGNRGYLHRQHFFNSS